MNRTIPVLTAAAFAATALPASGAVLAQYAFDAGSRADVAGNMDVVAGDFIVNDGGDEGSSRDDIGFSSSSNSTFYRSDATGATFSATEDDFFTFTLSAADPLDVLNLESLQIDVGGTNTTSVDLEVTFAFTTSAAAGSEPLERSFSVPVGTDSAAFASAPVIDLSAAAYQGVSSITFSVYAYDNLNSENAIPRFDNVVVNGSVVPIPEPTSALAGAAALGGLLMRRRR
jgi:hypothetical protein